MSVASSPAPKVTVTRKHRVPRPEINRPGMPFYHSHDGTVSRSALPSIDALLDSGFATFDWNEKHNTNMGNTSGTQSASMAPPPPPAQRPTREEAAQVLLELASGSRLRHSPHTTPALRSTTRPGKRSHSDDHNTCEFPVGGGSQFSSSDTTAPSVDHNTSESPVGGGSQFSSSDTAAPPRKRLRLILGPRPAEPSGSEQKAAVQAAVNQAASNRCRRACDKCRSLKCKCEEAPASSSDATEKRCLSCVRNGWPCCLPGRDKGHQNTASPPAKKTWTPSLSREEAASVLLSLAQAPKHIIDNSGIAPNASKRSKRPRSDDDSVDQLHAASHGHSASTDTSPPPPKRLRLILHAPSSTPTKTNTKSPASSTPSRRTRACDECRTLKRKCEKPSTSSPSRCSSCIKNGWPCRFERTNNSSTRGSADDRRFRKQLLREGKEFRRGQR